jgi:hypothetical protein
MSVRRDRRIDVQANLCPRGGVEATSGLILALWAAADVEKGFHSDEAGFFLISSLRKLLRKNPTPL